MRLHKGNLHLNSLAVQDPERHQMGSSFGQSIASLRQILASRLVLTAPKKNRCTGQAAKGVAEDFLRAITDGGWRVWVGLAKGPEPSEHSRFTRFWWKRGWSRRCQVRRWVSDVWAGNISPPSLSLCLSLSLSLSLSLVECESCHFVCENSTNS